MLDQLDKVCSIFTFGFGGDRCDTISFSLIGLDDPDPEFLKTISEDSGFIRLLEQFLKHIQACFIIFQRKKVLLYHIP